eukprot:8497037-Lingulodinium_polyedra.AAC.1
MGLHGLGPRDEARVQQANQLLGLAAKIIRACARSSVRVVLENPSTSRLWLTPTLRGLLRMQCASWQTTDYCQEGLPWRKRTALAAWHFPELACACRRCTGHGTCSRTGQRHVALTGRDASGVFMTLRAQPYPRKLCRRIAALVMA